VRVAASAGVTEIVEKLKTMTLLEASELVSEIEKTFGVDASAAVAGPAMVMAAAPGAAAAPAVEEKTTFDVVLEDIPADKKVAIYKVVRNIANIAVNQVKDFTATLPKVLKEGASKEEAADAVKQLTDAGAKAKVA
jgi:large subunit ribosomal protein L7/L12